MKRIAKYSIKLVRESNCAYECDNVCQSPSSIAQLVKQVYHLDEECEEKMILICLDAKCKVIGVFEVSSGTLTSSMVHPREIFKRAFELNTYGIVLAHNHPSSGTTTPSKEDIQITKRIEEGGKLLGLPLLDHLVIGFDNDFSSLKELGYL